MMIQPVLLKSIRILTTREESGILECEVKWALGREVKVTQLCPALCDPMVCSLPGSSVHEFSRQFYWSGQPFPLQGIYPNQGLNPGLLHCRQILSESPEKRWCHPVYLTSMKSRSYKVPGQINHKLESRLPRGKSTTLDKQMIPL